MSEIDDSEIRVVLIDGEPWWVLRDIWDEALRRLSEVGERA